MENGSKPFLNGSTSPIVSYLLSLPKMRISNKNSWSFIRLVSFPGIESVQIENKNDDFETTSAAAELNRYWSCPFDYKTNFDFGKIQFRLIFFFLTLITIFSFVHLHFPFLCLSHNLPIFVFTFFLCISSSIFLLLLTFLFLWQFSSVYPVVASSLYLYFSFRFSLFSVFRNGAKSQHGLSARDSGCRLSMDLKNETKIKAAKKKIFKNYGSKEKKYFIKIMAPEKVEDTFMEQQTKYRNFYFLLKYSITIISKQWKL